MTLLLASHKPHRTFTARALGDAGALALNAEGKAPDWIMLIPAGRVVAGRDHRRFTMADPGAVVTATQGHLPLPVDYEHDFELRRPGDATPAAGWIEALEIRDGAIWGRVDWTPKAANAIADKEYRFISPAFHHTADDQACIVRLLSAGLVHRPNFVMPALNHEQDTTMDKELAKALGLAETATVAEAVTAINALEAPSPAKYVPRADYDQVLTRATNAEQQLAALEAERSQAEATALVDRGIAEGKIAPASRAHYLKIAVASRADIEALIASTPAFLKPGHDESLAQADPARGQAGALLPDELAICAQLGLSGEAFLKARG
jgi:phage I-like protein